jgi:hypothetical protein
MLLPATVLMALAGCESGSGAKQGDPFLGFQRSAMSNATAGAGAASAQMASDNAPPLPATHALTSQAALAAGTTPAPDNPRDLRIGSAPVVPASLPSGGTARGAAPGGAMLHEPEPVPETTARLTPVATTDAAVQRTAASSPVAVAPPAATGGMSFEQAQQILKQYGVTWQRLETWGDKGQWKFRCSVPNPRQPNVQRTYETTKPLPYDPLSAVRAVLNQIEQERR